MRSNGAHRQGQERVIAGLNAEQKKRGLKLVPDSNAEQDGPDQGTVVQMVRHAIGPRLDALQQATTAAREAQRLRELAKWSGDQQAEDALAQSLRGLEAAARIAA